MATHTLKTLRFEHRMIFKVRLTIFQHYASNCFSVLAIYILKIINECYKQAFVFSG